VLAQRVEILVEAVEQQETQAVPEVPEMLPNKVMLTRDLQERQKTTRGPSMIVTK
jgi:hypothetical protein